MQKNKKASFNIVGLERLLDCMATTPSLVRVENTQRDHGAITKEVKVDFATSGLFEPIGFTLKKFSTDPKYKPGILRNILGNTRNLEPSYVLTIAYGGETKWSYGVTGASTEFSAIANAFSKFNDKPIGLTPMETNERIDFIRDLKRILY